MAPLVRRGYSEEGEELNVAGMCLMAVAKDKIDNFDTNLDLDILTDILVLGLSTYYKKGEDLSQGSLLVDLLPWADELPDMIGVGALSLMEAVSFHLSKVMGRGQSL